MIVICEDCAKKYNVDETRIKGDKARFSCYECGHIIVVKKPNPVKSFSEATEEPEASGEIEVDNMPETPEIKAMIGEEDMTYVESQDSLEEQQGKGRFTGTLFKMTIITAILVVAGISVYMYLQ